MEMAHTLMHCVAKYKSDNDFVFAVRRLCHVSKPEMKHHQHHTSQVNTAEEVQQFFADQASGKYAEVLCDVLDTLFDLTGLRHCGFECEPSDSIDLIRDSPKVLLQDADSERMVNFAVGILTQRCEQSESPQKQIPTFKAKYSNDKKTFSNINSRFWNRTSSSAPNLHK